MSTPSPRTPFRMSRYIDFNHGTVTMPPQQFADNTPKPWNLDKTIELFECRVEVWQLGVAARILSEIEAHTPPSIWSHSAYGLLAIVFSYFEMVGKTLNPVLGTTGTASETFNRGFCDVYTRYTPPNGCYADKLPSPGHSIPAPLNADIGETREYRDRIRNGIYHLAYTKRGLIIHDDDSISVEDFAVVPDPATILGVRPSPGGQT